MKKIIDNSHTKFRTLLKFGTFLILAALSVSPVFAQTAPNLTVAPARQQLELKPAESTSIIFKLANGSATPISGTLSVLNFIVTKNDGKPEFLEGRFDLPEKYAAASWFKLPYERLTLPANGKVETQIKIVVPKTALPGGHYAAIIFEPAASPFTTTTTAKAGQSAITPRIAGLVYIVVPGDYQETALLTDFSAPKFSQSGPIDITSAIKNTSPVHIRPTGTITITNMFGDIVTNLPLDEANIFPEATKAYKNTIPTKWLIGRYKADLSVAYGTQGKVLSGTIFFTVFPMILVIYLVILILSVAFLIKYLVKRGKKHEQELEKEVQELKTKLEEK